jgi:sensor domain CHASE-containing protein
MGWTTDKSWIDSTEYLDQPTQPYIQMNIGDYFYVYTVHFD